MQLNELGRRSLIMYQVVLYLSAASQWANVAHLALREKEIGSDDYELREIDLGT